MTTFQDPPPQSRRAVRQNERGDNPEGPVGFNQFPPPQPASAPPFYADSSAQRDMSDSTSRRAAQIPPAPQQAPDAAPPVTGRRSAGAGQAPGAEPLNYSTQSRPTGGVPSYDGPSFRNRLDEVSRQNTAAAAAQPAPAPAVPTADQGGFRVRDFSPESRRAAPSASPSWSESVPQQVASPSDLDYHTEARAGYGSPTAEAPAAPAAPVAPVPASQLPIEQTLTRRELRALLQAEEQANTTAQETAAQNSAANPAGMTETTLQSPAPYQPYQPPAQHHPQPEPPAQPSAPVFQAPPAPLEAPPTPDSYQTNVLPEVVLPPVAPEPSTNTGLTNALAEFDALSASASASAAATQTSVVSRPVGHWATQLDLEDDDSDVPETTINRKIGSGHTATSALVLGSIPMGDIRGALTGSGEIMLTGSIDLPRNLSSTGASDRIDHEGMDAMFEQHDAEAHSTDSVPVRAISAVSTHTSGHGVTHTKKPKGTKHLTALLISASAMAVVAVGLLIAAFAFNVF